MVSYRSSHLAGFISKMERTVSVNKSVAYLANEFSFYNLSIDLMEIPLKQSSAQPSGT